MKARNERMCLDVQFAQAHNERMYILHEWISHKLHYMIYHKCILAHSVYHSESAGVSQSGSSRCGVRAGPQWKGAVACTSDTLGRLCASSCAMCMRQCVAVCCSVLQCAAVCCSVLQCVCGVFAVCCSVLQCVAVCAAVCCSVLQCVTVCWATCACRAVPCAYVSISCVCCSVLQCVAVCCSVLQCAAVCCSVLQCAALCCSVL